MMDESAVSDIIGAILLIGLVGLGVTLIGVVVVSQPLPQALPHVSASAENTSTQVLVKNNGGDAIGLESILVRVNGQAIPGNRISIIPESGGTGTSWKIGSTLQIDCPGPDKPRSVQVVYSDGSSEQVIFTSYFVPP
ncbi:MAG: type IV pilin [Methanomicrobiales archaeon]|nr:type IV pilin [Methanomicrobiales archaeon]